MTLRMFFPSPVFSQLLSLVNDEINHNIVAIDVWSLVVVLCMSVFSYFSD